MKSHPVLRAPGLLELNQMSRWYFHISVFAVGDLEVMLRYSRVWAKGARRLWSISLFEPT